MNFAGPMFSSVSIILSYYFWGILSSFVLKGFLYYKEYMSKIIYKAIHFVCFICLHCLIKVDDPCFFFCLVPYIVYVDYVVESDDK